METLGFIIVFGGSAFFIIVGIFLVKHYFDVNRTSEDSYFNHHPWLHWKLGKYGTVRGNPAKKYVWRYLVNGIFYLFFGLIFLIVVVLEIFN